MNLKCNYRLIQLLIVCLFGLTLLLPIHANSDSRLSARVLVLDPIPQLIDKYEKTPEDRDLGEFSLNYTYLLLNDESLWLYPEVDVIEEISKAVENVQFDVSTLKVNGIPLEEDAKLIPVSGYATKINTFSIQDDAKQLVVSFCNETNGTSTLTLTWDIIKIDDLFVGPLSIMDKQTVYHKGETIRLSYDFLSETLESVILPLQDEKKSLFDISSWLNDNGISISDGTKMESMIYVDGGFSLNWILPSESQLEYTLVGINTKGEEIENNIELVIENKELTITTYKSFESIMEPLSLDLASIQSPVQLIDSFLDRLNTEQEDLITISAKLNDVPYGLSLSEKSILVGQGNEAVDLSIEQLKKMTGGIALNPACFTGFRPFSSKYSLIISASDQEGSSVSFPERVINVFNSNHLYFLLCSIAGASILIILVILILHIRKQRHILGNAYVLSLPHQAYGQPTRVDVTAWHGRPITVAQLALLGGLAITDQDAFLDMEKIHIHAKGNGTFRMKGHYQWIVEGEKAEMTLGDRGIQLVISVE